MRPPSDAGRDPVGGLGGHVAPPAIGMVVGRGGLERGMRKQGRVTMKVIGRGLLYGSGV